MLQESNRVEFKEKLNDKLEKEIVAFLNNKEGGILYIGLNTKVLFRAGVNAASSLLWSSLLSNS